MLLQRIYGTTETNKKKIIIIKIIIKKMELNK